MKTLTRQEIINISWIQKLYPNNVYIGDNQYNLPKLSWILNDFYSFYREELIKLGVYDWNEKFDCEDFARQFKTLAQICHLKSGGNADGLAVGEFSYLRYDGVKHAANFVLTEKGPFFIEPQSGQILKLSPNEIDSINRVHI